VSAKKLATVWLDGCSGCHMSLLDLDERLVELGSDFDLVYSPLVDHKVFPEGVDISLVEGAVSSEEDEHKIRFIRERTRILVAFGDCAVTGNVPLMRNFFSVDALLHCVYGETLSAHRVIPSDGVPKLLPRVRPVHEVVSVDLFIPSCPPAPDIIYNVLRELLAGRIPNLAGATHFGA
jgi:NAD-reducing hydrogenase small subunit